MTSALMRFKVVGYILLLGCSSAASVFLYIRWKLEVHQIFLSEYI